ncbi:MAG TPA: C4-type zinc ribbon domain-containing protein [Candidatus Cloacimonadota bacterium]|nr:C4-type zinc ribbon domain-containing protein [Candidatus Cloacimonadota bacterium]
MNKKLEILIEMQKCDDAIGEKEGLMQSLPQELNSLKNNLESANAQLEESKMKLEENLKTQRMKELEIKSNKEKIDKYKNQLLTIQTNKEYKALNSEVSHLENLNTLIDDDIIELMEAEANLRSQIEARKRVQDKAQEELSANEDKLKMKIVEVEKEIAVIREHRNEMAKDLPQVMVKRYAALIKSKNRKAVVFEENKTCSGCHYLIRPQQIIEINKGENVVSCESCGRMLVAKPIE